MASQGSSASSKKKFVYFFGGGKAEGRGDQKTLLGGKGAGLAEMTNIGLPVPEGFTLTTEACEEYYKSGRKWPKSLEAEVKEHVARLEKVSKRKFGDAKSPLLVSCRSGAALSMPGMMETILNLGLNDVVVEGMAKLTKNPRFAYDSYRRLIQMYASTAMGLSKEIFEHAFDHFKSDVVAKRLKRGPGEKIADTEVNGDELKALCGILKTKFKELAGIPFPQDPWKQLEGAINAVFGSWMADKAVTYRRVEKIRESDVRGTGVNICRMVFGNLSETSGTGVAFTRDPSTGKDEFYGDYLFNAQGEDVVAGIRTPVNVSELKRQDPKAYAQLDAVRRKLERHYKDMQDIEFTVEEGTLYMLQTRRGKRTPSATFKIAVDMVKENLITPSEAVLRIAPEDIERLFYPEIDPKIDRKQREKAMLATGINAVPGAAYGKVYFNAPDAEAAKARNEDVILVRRETSPEDVGGMHAAKGILTQTGGKTSHAAVVARGWGKCCIVGCDAISIDYAKQQMVVKGQTIKQGDFLTLDGNTGEVFKGQLALVTPTLPAEYQTLMKWADQIRTINVRTNADTPYDAKKAIEMGAEGIGLCRTEHMFFDTEARRDAIQEMIVAESVEARIKALNKLLPFQRDDFAGIFREMAGLPVTIRLIDPPLHEFVPHDEAGQKRLAEKIGVPVAKVTERVSQLHEANPMLGHRGCRLAVTYPEILDMQVRAIIEAACICQKEKIKVKPEIMIPLVIDAKELKLLEVRTRKVADEVIAKAGVGKLAYLVGTMIEIPRAALMAHEIAEVAEFFSFGTNDLTQTTMGLSRDDAGRFLPDYVDEKKAGVFRHDPFQVLDQAGVGQLVQMGIERGRSSRPDLKVGICGEHGGEQQSVKFCVKLGMNYVSCSPYRVPIARLAAAQAAVEQGLVKAKPATKAAKAAKPAAKAVKAAPKAAAKPAKAAPKKAAKGKKKA